MAVNRRMLLLTGSTAIVITGAGWALTRGPKAARAPWRKASEGFGDPRLDMLAYAILAPNPHNMQPWRIRLDGDDAFTVFCDLTRLLPETDPPNRQITIGFGCFLELVRQAAAEKGYRAEISAFPEGEPFPTLDERPVAQVILTSDDTVQRDPLFSEVLSRRTNRLPYDTAREVSENDLSAIAGVASPSVNAEVFAGAERISALRTLTTEAWRTEWNTPQARRESIAVTRIGKKEINAAPYGLALTGALMEALNKADILTREKMDDPKTTAFEQSLLFYEKACETAMAYAVIKTAANTRRDQLETGRTWVRMQLAANAAGVAFHPLSQALQEFPEMAPHYDEAHRLLGAKAGETVQMLVRLGYAKDVPPAPREALTSRLIAV